MSFRHSNKKLNDQKTQHQKSIVQYKKKKKKLVDEYHFQKNFHFWKIKGSTLLPSFSFPFTEFKWKGEAIRRQKRKETKKNIFFPFPFSLWQQVSLFIRGYLNGKPFLLRGEKELRENAILVKLKILFFHLISVFPDWTTKQTVHNFKMAQQSQNFFFLSSPLLLFSFCYLSTF